jgi:YidC/Oxa1 family membrane protein insertase
MAVNAQKMQSIQPEMSKLKEALKDEPTKMMTAQQLLLKKAGINQLAGCLPAMIQLPIVIGLYRCVSDTWNRMVLESRWPRHDARLA